MRMRETSCDDDVLYVKTLLHVIKNYNHVLYVNNDNYLKKKKSNERGSHRTYSKCW